MSDLAFLVYTAATKTTNANIEFFNQNGNPWAPEVANDSSRDFVIQISQESDPCQIRSITFWFKNSSVAGTYLGPDAGATPLINGAQVVDIVTSETTQVTFTVDNNLGSDDDGVLDLQVSLEDPDAGRILTSRDPQITLRGNEGGPGGGLSP